MTGNYGMWNAYALVMMVLYAPDSAAAKGECRTLVMNTYNVMILLYMYNHVYRAAA